jgi:hypothetical protein
LDKNKDVKVTGCDEPVVFALANFAGISLPTGSFLPDTKKLITDDFMKWIRSSTPHAIDLDEPTLQVWRVLT